MPEERTQESKQSLDPQAEPPETKIENLDQQVPVDPEKAAQVKGGKVNMQDISC
jgi:hypothetical protein